MLVTLLLLRLSVGVFVTVGEPHVLDCTVFVGTDAEDPSEPPIVYWLVNSTEYPEDFSPLIVEGETT